jgi:hypothetical protein
MLNDAHSQPQQSTPPQSAGTLRRAAGRDRAVFEAWCAANNHVKLREAHNEVGDSSREMRASSAIQPEEIGAMNHAIRITTRDRRFIVSKSGRIGIAPKEAVFTFPTADEIFAVAGGGALLVLRPVGTRDIPGVGWRLCYELVGDCYLHGFMDGEAMDNYDVVKQTIHIVNSGSLGFS